ncbi:flippase [Vibrio cyclitrophicus]
MKRNDEFMKEQKLKSNILYLGIVQIVSYGAPLLTFPYLTRVLGVDGFGDYSFSLAIMAYFVLFVNFGFDSSATVEINKKIENKENVAKILTSIYLLKIFFCIVCVGVILIIGFLNIIDVNLFKLLIYSVPLLFGTAISSVYIFQSYGFVKEMSVIEVICRLCSVPFIFIFVNSEPDAYLACFIQSISVFVSGLISVLFLRKKNIVNKLYFSKKEIVNSARSGYMLFKLSCATSLYTNSIPVLIGVMSNTANVGLYNVANTIRNIIYNILKVIFRALFPKITSMVYSGKVDEAKKLLRKVFCTLIPLVLLGVFIIFYFSEEIISIVSGREFIHATTILRLLSIVLLISVINNFYGMQTLVPFGFQNEFSNAVVVASITSIIAIVPLIFIWGAIGGGVGVIFCELFVFVLLFKIHRNKSLNVF